MKEKSKIENTQENLSTKCEFWSDYLTIYRVLDLLENPKYVIEKNSMKLIIHGSSFTKLTNKI